MTLRVRLLTQLLDTGMYAVDETAVAQAILARAQTRARVRGVGSPPTGAGTAPVPSATIRPPDPSVCPAPQPVLGPTELPALDG